MASTQAIAALGHRMLFDDAKALPQIEVRLATETAELDRAFRLVHDQYVWRRYADRASNGRRLCLHNALPTTRVFIAASADSFVGTVTLMPDSRLGLPIEELYGQELSGFRAEGRRVAEVGALAMASTHRRQGLPILLSLMRSLVLYGAEVAQLDDLVVTLNPRHVDFYQRYLHFEQFGGLKYYDRVNGHPAYALRLDLRLVRSLIETFRSRPPRNNLYAFFLSPEECDRIVSGLYAQLPYAGLTAEQFRVFFGDGELLAAASPEQRTLVESLYPRGGTEREWRGNDGRQPLARISLRPAVAAL